MARAMEHVSSRLNNTPEVARRAYVFRGVVVLFVTNPELFEREVARGVGRPLRRGGPCSRFDDGDIDWKDLLQHSAMPNVKYTQGDVSVLLIPDAGSEGVDLVGVRHILFADIPWTEMREAQIEGRGQRFRSHAHLPPSQRRVEVWKLVLSLPDGSESADERNLEIIQRKREMREEFYRGLAKVSI